MEPRARGRPQLGPRRTERRGSDRQQPHPPRPAEETAAAEARTGSTKVSLHVSMPNSNLSFIQPSHLHLNRFSPHKLHHLP